MSTHDMFERVVSTPATANLRKTLDPNSPNSTPKDLMSTPAFAGPLLDITGMDQQLRHRREHAEKQQDHHMKNNHHHHHHHQVDTEVACRLPSEFGHGASSFANLRVRPHRTPFRQISCAVCARESMVTPPQNATRASGFQQQCTCRGGRVEIGETHLPLVPTPRTPSDIQQTRRRDAFVSGTIENPGTPLVLRIDSDVEDYDVERPKRFLLKPKIQDARSKSASPTRSEFGHWPDEMDYSPHNNNNNTNPRVVESGRPLRRRLRRASGCTTTIIPRTLPVFPLSTPEHARPIFQSAYNAPFDVPMLDCTPNNSKGADFRNDPN